MSISSKYNAHDVYASNVYSFTADDSRGILEQPRDRYSASSVSMGNPDSQDEHLDPLPSIMSSTQRTQERDTTGQSHTSSQREVPQRDMETTDTNRDLAPRQVVVESYVKDDDEHNGGEKILFDQVRSLCENNDVANCKGPDPHQLADHRARCWPKATGLPPELTRIYETVRRSGLPNAIGARMQIPSKLNLKEWDKTFGNDDRYEEMLNFVKFGFPMGYMGPTSHYDEKYNHTSATQYSEHIDKFLLKETQLGGIIGPSAQKPFEPWLHAAPLMSRPKKDSDARRVIADLTFPEESSVNAYIMKNGVWGETRCHSLPTVEAFVEKLKGVGSRAHMSIIDISRAYKNFRSDPLDWPLLCGYWNGEYYCDVTMPFGSRASSYHMQCVANAITEVLGTEGIVAYMYLDDLITLSKSRQEAEIHHRRVLELLEALGLPVAEEKVQPPSSVVEWLGININARLMTLSIPMKKINETVEVVKKYKARRSMSKKELQSMIGKLVHVAKCVPPARLFISRLLEALRQANKKYLKVTQDMKEDLNWFSTFCKDWNGVYLITPSKPTTTITVDASMTGIGASDGKRAYGKQIAADHQIARNISELESLNIAVALHTFVDSSFKGGHVHLFCDNSASVQVMESGKGRNKIILEVARYIWMLQAQYQFSITYEHIKGKDNVIADALSRAHLSPAMADIANTHIQQNNIQLVDPCLYMFDVINHDIFL